MTGVPTPSERAAAMRDEGSPPPAPDIPRAGLAAGLVLILLTGLIAFLLVSTSNQIEDDAFIFFRYVDNLLGGHGLTWNPGGERVEGYSSFLFVMVLLPLRALGLEPVRSAHALNMMLFLSLVPLGAWVLRQVTGHWGRATLIGPALLMTSAQMSAFARNGMESMLFAVTITLALGLHLRDSPRPLTRVVSGAVFGLAMLARPEGVLVFLAALAHGMWLDRSRGEGWFARSRQLQLAGFVAVIVPHLVWRLIYYGEPLPNTYYAKVGLFHDGLLSRGAKGLTSFLGTFRGGLAAVALVLWAVVRRRNNLHAGNLLAMLLAGWMAYLTIILGLPRWGLWYTMPVDLFTALLLATSLGPLLARREAVGVQRTAWVLGAALLVLGNLSGGINRNLQSGKGLQLALIDPPDRAVVNQFIRIGHELGRIAGEGETVAVGACGAIPYYSGLVTHDVLGLNDKHIARVRIDGPVGDAFGHEKGDGAYILSREPTYLIPLPVITQRPSRRPSGFEKSFNEIFRDPTFQRDYEFASVALSEREHFNYYRRKDGAP